MTPNVARTACESAAGLGLDDIAKSQNIEAYFWKSDSMRPSLFAEYDRVGEYCQAPYFAIKRQDAFVNASGPRSTVPPKRVAVLSGVETGPEKLQRK
jgi:hypothetical protein